MSTQIESLTDALQKELGIQQAAQITPENLTADALARLHGKRGNADRILALWHTPIREVGADLVADFRSDHERDLIELRAVLQASLAVSRGRDGSPRTFRPFSVRLIHGRSTGTDYRDSGRGVAEALWGADPELRARLQAQTSSWERAHPLARLLAPLTPEPTPDEPKDRSRLAALIDQDEPLRSWRDRVVLEDWRAWLAGAKASSPDEQLESMTSLIGLHLFSALVQRLGCASGAGPVAPPYLFAAVDGQRDNPVATRGATSFYSFWLDRADVALRAVATAAVERVEREDAGLADGLRLPEWSRARAWLVVPMDAKGPTYKKFRARLEEKCVAEQAQHAAPGPGRMRALVIDTLTEVFSSRGGVSEKVKSYLRSTGAAAGLVGPIDKGARKRFLLDERGLMLLARLHAHRGEDKIRSQEEDRRSVNAFLDDVFARYGLVLSLDRQPIRDALLAPEAKHLARLLPSEDALRRNREQLDRRLEALRLIRRYSDASTVIHTGE